MGSLRLGKTILLVAICGFFAAAVYISLLIAERQTAIKAVSRYNICWLASQALAEFSRFETTLASFGVPGTKIDPDEIQLRVDILQNRLVLLQNGEFKEFSEYDPENAAVADELRTVLDEVQPLIDNVRQPGAVTKALAILAPLDPKLAHLAASANLFGGDRIVQDQHELIRLYWIFSSVVGGLFVCGLGLLAFLGWHNKLLGQAQVRQHLLTMDLRNASIGLEQAHEEVTAINGQLQARNEILQLRDRELGTQNERFDAALNNISQGLCMVDSKDRLVVHNQRFVELFGAEFTPIPGMPFPSLIDLSPGASLRELHTRQCALSVESGSFVFTQSLTDGRTVSVSHKTMAHGGWVATYEDISQRRQDEARISYLAHHDGLTGLINRAFFLQQLEPAVAQADGRGGRLAVLCLDLDGFKEVNDSFGHPTGDALLQQVAARLTQNALPRDLVARLGGDEFAILHILANRPEECGALASRLIDCLSIPFDLDGIEVKITVSIGIARAPADGNTADEMMKNADLALYRAKSEGKGAFRFFQPAMEADRRERRMLESDLRSAVANQELQVYFQPLVNVRQVEITGFEALVRWRHPVRGMVSPADFIQIAEEIGEISRLGEWVLNEACARAAAWPSHLSVSVNLSPAQFKCGCLVGTVKQALAHSGLPATRLELEITESVMLVESESTLRMLHELRLLGVRIALDDFGTGYSSLSYLRSFPFDKIKIDQSFVRQLSSRPDCIKIVHSIATLGKSLGMMTTAEGVETIEQFAQLRDAGCDQVQGYYFGRPQPIELLRYKLPILDHQNAAAA